MSESLGLSVFPGGCCGKAGPAALEWHNLRWEPKSFQEDLEWEVAICRICGWQEIRLFFLVENHKWVNVVFRACCELASPRRFVVITFCKNYHCLPGSFHHTLLLQELEYLGSHCRLGTYLLFCRVDFGSVFWAICSKGGNPGGRKGRMQGSLAKVVFLHSSKGDLAKERSWYFSMIEASLQLQLPPRERSFLCQF